MSSTSERPSGQEDKPVLTLAIERSNDAPAVARTAIMAFCETRDIPESVLPSVKLLVSELVTNAVTHPDAEASANVRLFARVEPGVLRVEVTDDGSGFERTSPPDPSLSGSGYGLFLLDKEAARWGVDNFDGNRVWFEVTLDEDA